MVLFGNSTRFQCYILLLIAQGLSVALEIYLLTLDVKQDSRVEKPKGRQRSNWKRPF